MQAKAARHSGKAATAGLFVKRELRLASQHLVALCGLELQS